MLLLGDSHSNDVSYDGVSGKDVRQRFSPLKDMYWVDIGWKELIWDLNWALPFKYQIEGLPNPLKKKI